MREHEIEIADIGSGLRHWKSNVRNSKGKTELHCLMPHEKGLVEMDVITNINETTSSYLVDESGNYIVDESGNKVIL